MCVFYRILNCVCVQCVAGSDFKDDSLNIMPFFSASCFSGFEDNSKVCVCVCE